MGVSSTTNRVSYAGDGSSTIFAFPYYFFSPSDLSVFLYDINSSLVVSQTLNTNFTVSGSINAQGIYPSGGNVVMNSSFPSSKQIIITRSPAQTQNFQQAQNAPINSLALVQEMDYLTLLVQRLQDEVARCVHIPDGLGTGSLGAFDPTIPSSVTLTTNAGSPLLLNSGATGWQFGLVATGASGAISYAGILPVSNGGTGQGLGLTPFGVAYAASGSSLATTAAGGQDVPFVGNAGAAPSFQPLNLSSGSSSTGTLIASRGGTGLSSFNPQFGVMYASNATTMSIIPSVTAGMWLQAKGSSVPVFEQFNLNSSAQYTGILPIVNGGTAGSSGVQALTNLWPSPLTRGDILVVNSGGVVTRLAVGTDNTALFSNSSALNPTGLLWQSPSSTSQSVTSKTANYQMTSNDDFVNVSSSGFTVSLPDATTATKKVYRILKTDSTIAQILVAASGAQTIGTFGNQVHMWTQNESWQIYPDGANWQINQHNTATPWTPFPSLAFGTLWTSLVANGAYSTSLRTHHAEWRRDGRQWVYNYAYGASTAGSSGTGMLLFNLISGITIDSSLVTPNSSALGTALTIDSYCGACTVGGTTNTYTPGQFLAYSTTQLKAHLIGINATGFFGQGGLVDFGNNPGSVTATGAIPMLNWEP